MQVPDKQLYLGSWVSSACLTTCRACVSTRYTPPLAGAREALEQGVPLENTTSHGSDRLGSGLVSRGKSAPSHLTTPFYFLKNFLCFYVLFLRFFFLSFFFSSFSFFLPSLFFSPSFCPAWFVKLYKLCFARIVSVEN